MARQKNRIALGENNGTIIEVVKTDEFSLLMQENEGRVEKIKPQVNYESLELTGLYPKSKVFTAC